MKPERLIIFDTTLRDGEQCPGASMNNKEKLEIARQLSLLKVDVIEAGFPVASPGDFESVRQIAKEIKGSSVAGLARALEKDIEAAARAAFASLKSYEPDAPARRELSARLRQLSALVLEPVAEMLVGQQAADLARRGEPLVAVVEPS